MSRIGKNPVAIPSDVTIALKDNVITAKGKLGELSFSIPENVTVEHKDNEISVMPANDTRQARALWGMSRSMIANTVEGVSTGFKKELELKGVGYRAQMRGTKLVLSVGYSHDVEMEIPEGLKAECPSQTEIVVSGSSKQRVGQLAANIRSVRSPEPYKGKGIRYKGEYVPLKEGKKK